MEGLQVRMVDVERLSITEAPGKLLKLLVRLIIADSTIKRLLRLLELYINLELDQSIA